MTPVVKELWIVNLPFHDSLYCWGRHAFKIPTRGESMSRPEQNAPVNNGIVLLLRTTIKKITLTFHRSFYECLISSNGGTPSSRPLQGSGGGGYHKTACYDVVRYNKTNATSLWCCQHDCIPLWSFVTLGWQSSLGGYNHAGNPTEMLHLFNVMLYWRSILNLRLQIYRFFLSFLHQVAFWRDELKT